MNNTTLYQKEVSFQVDRRRSGVELIKIISDLWYDKSIEMVLFKNQLLDKGNHQPAPICR
jgi:glyceraldehyde 3-phosphate dehydrogenase